MQVFIFGNNIREQGRFLCTVAQQGSRDAGRGGTTDVCYGVSSGAWLSKGGFCLVFLYSSVQGDPPTYPPQGCRVSGDAAVSGGSAGLCEVAEFATLVPAPRAPSTEELCCKDQISGSSPVMNCKRNVVRT